MWAERKKREMDHEMSHYTFIDLNMVRLLLKTPPMKAKILQLAARILAGVSRQEFKEVVNEVVTIDSEEVSGAEKFKEVVNRVRNRWPEAFWVLQTLVQIAYAYAKIKNLFPAKALPKA